MNLVGIRGQCECTFVWEGGGGAGNNKRTLMRRKSLRLLVVANELMLLLMVMMMTIGRTVRLKCVTYSACEHLHVMDLYHVPLFNLFTLI